MVPLSVCYSTIEIYLLPSVVTSHSSRLSNLAKNEISSETCVVVNAKVGGGKEGVAGFEHPGNSVKRGENLHFKKSTSVRDWIGMSKRRDWDGDGDDDTDDLTDDDTNAGDNDDKDDGNREENNNVSDDADDRDDYDKVDDHDEYDQYDNDDDDVFVVVVDDDNDHDEDDDDDDCDDIDNVDDDDNARSRLSRSMLPIAMLRL